MSHILMNMIPATVENDVKLEGTKEVAQYLEVITGVRCE